MLQRVGRRAGRDADLVAAPTRRQRRRAARRRCRAVVPADVRGPGDRHVVADRDGRHHDLQLPLAAGSTRVDGATAARHRGRPAGTRRRRRSRHRRPTGHRSRSPIPSDRANWRCGPAGPRCSGPTSTRRSATVVVRRRLVPNGRPRPTRCRRLLLVRRSRRRRDQDLRPPDRTVRGRVGAQRASRRRRDRRDRQARPDRRDDRQGLRRARPRPRADRRTPPRTDRALREPASVLRSRHARSSSSTPSPTPAAARSCGACSRPANSARTRATPRRSSRRRNDGTTMTTRRLR